MYRERITDANIANDKALEMVYRTEQMIFVLLVPKQDVNIDTLQPNDTEFMLTDEEGIEGILGALLGAFHLEQKENGEYIVRYTDLLESVSERKVT